MGRAGLPAGQDAIGVVLPRSTDDVLATVAACRRHGAPLLSRGGGTSLAGQCCNVAVVMDFSKYMHGILSLDPALPDAGRCGMAGGFGFEAEHYDVSMAAGERALLPKVREAGESTLLVADGFSCREQVRQATGREPLHLAQVVDRALRKR